MRILVDDFTSEETSRTFYTEKVRAEMAKLGDVEFGIFTRDELRDKLEGVDILFGGWGMKKVDDDLLQKADKLKMISYTGGSVADFMTEDCVKHGITVCSGNKYYANSVAEGTIGYILLAQRHLPDIINSMAESGWKGKYHYVNGIRFKTIGIIGFGMIAKNLAKMLQAFECKVKICSDWFTEDMQEEYRAEKCDLDELCSTCDIITLHESLREETYHMINKHCFDLMKDNALFVNTARSAIVHEAEMAEAMQTGRIRAVLDVYEKEPLSMDSPLRGLDNVILIPHCGGPTTDIREYVTLGLIDDIKRMLAGEPLEHAIPWEYAKNMTNHSTGKNK